MQKTLDILEKNVQWIVLGLAGLFLLWVAYGYVLTPPATVKIGSQIVTPGEVALVVKKSADELDREIKENKPISFPTPDLVTSWREHLAKPIGEVLAFDWSGSLPTPSGYVPTGPQGPSAPTIAVLPQPPAPQLLSPIAGLSSVTFQAPVIPQGANPPAPPQVQPVAASSKDTDWITVPAVISATALKDALLAPFNPKPSPTIGTFYNTTILRVVVEREQATGMNNGMPTWGAATPVAELSAEQPYMQPVPQNSADMNTKYQYIDWAKQNQTLLCDPPFYQVTAGDAWNAPQLPAPAPPGAIPARAAPPAPGATTPPPTGGTPASNPDGTPATATPNAAGMRLPGSTSYAPFDQDRPAGEWPPSRPRMPPQGPNAMFMPAGSNGNNSGVIDPFTLTNDILIWFIDDTVTPGQTYRYRIKYEIKNPVFDVQSMAPDKLTNVLVLTSLPSNWGDPITAPPKTKFWLSSAQRDQADLDVFQYENGEWKKSSLKASPGDSIPGTNLTLVDVRPVDPEHTADKYVLLTDDTGDMLRHDVNADQSDPDHAAMLNPNPTNAPGQRRMQIQGRPGRSPFGPGPLRPAIGHGG